MPSLRQCFDHHGCDRGAWHSYERVYEPIFEPIRNEPLSILEIGIWRGAGIWAWLEYFPNAHVFGIDDFRRVPPAHIQVLKHERVSYYRADSTTLEWRMDDPPPAWLVGPFDLIFDDGDHRADAQRETFENFHSALADGGRYFIEDVWPGKPGYEALLDTLDPFGSKHHDLRKGGRVDSYIIEIC